MHRTDRSLHRSPTARLVLAGAYAAPRGRDFPRHQHRGWEVVYYRRGRVCSPVGPDTHEVSAGTVVCTPPETPHAEIALTGYANFYVLLNAPADQPWPRIAFDDAEQTLQRVFAGLHREAAAGGDPELAQLLATELDLLLRRAGRSGRPDPAERLVAAAEQLLDLRHAGAVRIADVAAELGVSTSALRAHFVARRGVTPSAALQAVRLRHALGQLRHSTLTLEAIAGYCGYWSASHLSRHVKQATGRTPGQLR